MTSLRLLLLAGAAALPLTALSTGAAADSFRSGAPILLAQADIGELLARVDQARQAVMDAQSALADAQANGGDVAAAEAQLAAAQAELQAAEQAVAAAQAAEQQPQEEPPPPAEEPAAEPPPPPDQPAAEEPPPPAEEAAPPPPEEAAPPPEEPPPAAEPPPAEPPAAEAPAEQPPAAEAPPPEQPAAQPPADSGQPADAGPPPDQGQGEGQGQESGQSQGEGQRNAGQAPPPAQGSDALPAEDVPPPPPPGEALPPPPPPPPTGAAAEPVGTRTDQGQVVEQAEGGRTIFRTDDNQLIIQHNDQGRLERGARDVETINLGAGFTASILTRNSGVQIITVRDQDGNIVQRVRREPDGRETVLIGGPDEDRQIYRQGEFRRNFRPEDFRPPRGRPDFGFERELPPLVVPIPEEDYVVEAREASEPQIQEALVAPPLVQLPRAYTLDEIRGSEQLRNTVRRIDLDTVTFESGSAVVPPDQIDTLEQIGRALQAVIDSDPSQVFLIEGHTDAVGSDLYNLALSDRRAETVASILSTYFAIPPENLVTQGYGEQYLKVPTQVAERQNRRVTLRNITGLLQAQN